MIDSPAAGVTSEIYPGSTKKSDPYNQGNSLQRVGATLAG